MVRAVSTPWIRRWVILVSALAILLTSATAAAAGRVKWKSRTLKERSTESWKIELSFFMRRAPDTAHVPMKFEFKPTAYYERSMVDGDKLILRKVPLQHRQALIESVDVGFLDPRNDQTQKRTRFSFKVTRGHGFEAGEYRVTIRHGRSGQVIGTPVTLIFDGENPVIDRRTVSFVGGKKKKKKSQMKKVDRDGNIKEGEEAEPESEAATEESSSEEAESTEAEETESTEDEGLDEDITEEADGPPPIKQRPGGCGCRIEDTQSTHWPAALLTLGLFGGFFWRRNRAVL